MEVKELTENSPQPQDRETDEPPKTEDGLSLLACFSCKKRKVKCNRVLPTCSLCSKIGISCEYPTHAEKPGPKAGTPQKNKRRRLGDAPLTLSHDGQRDPSSGNTTENGYAVDVMGGIRRASYSVRDNTGLPRRRHSLSGVPDATIEQSANRNNSNSGPTFSQIMYPSHELQTRPQSPYTPDQSPDRPQKGGKLTVESVCEGLKISVETYTFLMECFFANMTSFSLFKPHAIETKLALMHSRAEAEALIASMFSFAARFDGGLDFGGRTEDCPSPSYFAHIASSQLDRALNECGDSTPPLWVLQACILVTFYQLTRSVRSRSWRALGSCIRLAYDMQLHIVDANHDRTAAREVRNIDMRRWSHMEERRRAWWAIWEMDVFASTIRRLPTAIDWSQNMTLLPVHDNCWFNDIYQNSCFLVKDPDLRWRCLAKSGNNSPRAWFIIINSLMRNTQLIVYPAGTAMQSPYDRRLESSQAELDIMANCLYCTTLSLPTELHYNGETLDFRTKYASDDITPRQYHSDKYTVHLMTQLARFMIYHHKICGQAPWLTKPTDSDEPEQSGNSPALLSDWSNYVNAADEIVSAIRNSAKDHFKFVNPFIVNTVWFAAAAQCACKVFGPPTFDKRVADSNLALLRLTVDRFITFWGSADTLKGKLARMEAGLRNLMARDAPKAAQGHPQTLRADSIDTSRAAYTPTMTDSSTAIYTTPATETSLGYPSGLDASASTGAEFMNPYDFTQTQPILPIDSAGLVSGSLDYFPYGLEELLMYGTNPYGSTNAAQ